MKVKKKKQWIKATLKKKHGGVGSQSFRQTLYSIVNLGTVLKLDRWSMKLSAHGCTMGLSVSRTTITSLFFFFLSHFSFTIAIRKDIGFKFIPLCKNTVQGRYLLSDNNGIYNIFFIFLISISLIIN
jgi:hypothetical protein